MCEWFQWSRQDGRRHLEDGVAVKLRVLCPAGAVLKDGEEKVSTVHFLPLRSPPAIPGDFLSKIQRLFDGLMMDSLDGLSDV